MTTAREKAPGWLPARPYAHRGLHDGDRAVPENSLAAARAAIAAGYGIECDLQPSRDGVPLVFHDDDLTRLTAGTGDIRDLAAGSASRHRLCGTDETIPTFADLLQLVAGRVPLLIELKGRGAREDAGFAARVAEVLAAYSGPAALMSFAPHLVADCRDHMPDRPVGLTAEGTESGVLAHHRAVAADGLDFVSYNHRHLPNPFTQRLRAATIPILCWTIRSDIEAQTALSACDQITFEGFEPTVAPDMK